MFKPNKIALIIATVLGASTAYAATVSTPTPPVVGFKPVYTNTTGKGAVTGKLALGENLAVDVTKLGYDDKDGDAHDVAKVEYKWTIGPDLIGNKPDVTIPNDPKYVGQQLQLEIIPVSVSGDPLKGNALVLANLVTAGATGTGTGTIIDNNAAPFIDNLQLGGALAVGALMTATYEFNANGGNPLDASTFAWGREGNTAAEITAGKFQNVQLSGNVPEYMINAADAGEVLELSVQAANGADIIGNMITVTTAGQVTGTGNGGTGTGGIGGIVTPPGGGGGGVVPFIKADPIAATITFNSTATKVDNDSAGLRPVANVDQLTATITPADGASPDLGDYTFRWLADGNEVMAATKGANTFTPGSAHQGMQISVEIAPAPAPAPAP